MSRPSCIEIVTEILKSQKKNISMSELLALAMKYAKDHKFAPYGREPLRKAALDLQDAGKVSVVSKNGRPYSEGTAPRREMHFIWLPTIEKIKKGLSVEEAVSYEEQNPVRRIEEQEPVEGPEFVTAFQSSEENISPTDTDALAWEQIKKAALESSWIPNEYIMNDWVSEVCEFLRNGCPKVEEQRVEERRSSEKPVFPNITEAMLDFGLKSIIIKLES